MYILSSYLSNTDFYSRSHEDLIYLGSVQRLTETNIYYFVVFGPAATRYNQYVNLFHNNVSDIWELSINDNQSWFLI